MTTIMFRFHFLLIFSTTLPFDVGDRLGGSTTSLSTTSTRWDGVIWGVWDGGSDRLRHGTIPSAPPASAAVLRHACKRRRVYVANAFVRALLACVKCIAFICHVFNRHTPGATDLFLVLHCCRWILLCWRLCVHIYEQIGNASHQLLSLFGGAGWVVLALFALLALCAFLSLLAVLCSDALLDLIALLLLLCFFSLLGLFVLLCLLGLLGLLCLVCFLCLLCLLCLLC